MNAENVLDQSIISISKLDKDENTIILHETDEVVKIYKPIVFNEITAGVFFMFLSSHKLTQLTYYYGKGQKEYLFSLAAEEKRD